MSMRSMRSRTSGGSGEEGGQVFTEVGQYRGAVVAIRRAQRATIKLSHQDLVELKVVWYLICCHVYMNEISIVVQHLIMYIAM